MPSFRTRTGAPGAIQNAGKNSSPYRNCTCCNFVEVGVIWRTFEQAERKGGKWLRRRKWRRESITFFVGSRVFYPFPLISEQEERKPPASGSPKEPFGTKARYNEIRPTNNEPFPWGGALRGGGRFGEGTLRAPTLAPLRASPPFYLLPSPSCSSPYTSYRISTSYPLPCPPSSSYPISSSCPLPSSHPSSSSCPPSDSVCHQTRMPSNPYAVKPCAIKSAGWWLAASACRSEVFPS